MRHAIPRYTSGKIAAKANKFYALRENESERDVDVVNGASFENEVNEAVKVALSSLFPDTKRIRKTRKVKRRQLTRGAITGDVITLARRFSQSWSSQFPASSSTSCQPKPNH